MRATELMIGDLVYASKDEHTILKVMTINGNTADCIWDVNNECDMNIDEFQPIPLTPEILEKNGFYYGNTASEEDFCNAVGCSYPEEGWCYDEGAGEIKILFPTESDGGLIRLDDQNADKHLELVFVEPIMLHELQHALKLCGIDKEIVL